MTDDSAKTYPDRGFRDDGPEEPQQDGWMTPPELYAVIRAEMGDDYDDPWGPIYVNAAHPSQRPHKGKGGYMTADRRYPDRGFKDRGPDRDLWEREGIELAQRHDATVFEISDWYLRGRRTLGPGECRRIIEAPGWQGVKFDTAKVYACASQSGIRQSLGT